MKKLFVILGLLIVIAIAVSYFYLKSPASIEKSCIASGGKVETGLCCQMTGDFPNLCLIGACGCSPSYSHEVKICNCGDNKCFDGSKCTALSFPE